MTSVKVSNMSAHQSGKKAPLALYVTSLHRYLNIQHIVIASYKSRSFVNVGTQASGIVSAVNAADPEVGGSRRFSPLFFPSF